MPVRSEIHEGTVPVKVYASEIEQKKFTMQDLERQTEGVICRKDQGVVDEIPGAYKDLDEVMANQFRPGRRHPIP